MVYMLYECTLISVVILVGVNFSAVKIPGLFFFGDDNFIHPTFCRFSFSGRNYGSGYGRPQNPGGYNSGYGGHGSRGGYSQGQRQRGQRSLYDDDDF